MNTIDIISLITVIVEIVWRLIMENISAPQWMHYVEWGLIVFIFVLVILHFVIRSKEKKQNKKDN